MWFEFIKLHLSPCIAENLESLRGEDLCVPNSQIWVHVFCFKIFNYFKQNLMIFTKKNLITNGKLDRMTNGDCKLQCKLTLLKR